MPAGGWLLNLDFAGGVGQQDSGTMLGDIYIQPSLNAATSRPRPVLNTEVISIQPTLNTAITIPERI